MRGSFIARLVVPIIACLWSHSLWAGPVSLSEAATLISRYPAGQLAETDSVRDALHVIGKEGTRREIGLLQQVILLESHASQLLALHAVREIRTRQITQQRAAFRAAMSEWVQDHGTMNPTNGAGPKEDECIAYAHWLVSQWPTVVTTPNTGNARLMLQQGRTKAALSAVLDKEGHEARMLEGQIREELGDVYGALAVYTNEFADGHLEAGQKLESYGVQPERLLLGLLSSDTRVQYLADDTSIIETLVRQGGTLTVRVLAERTKHPVPSEQTVAVDALGRMLANTQRRVPLSNTGRRVAHEALLSASRHRLEPIRRIALEALNQTPH